MDFLEQLEVIQAQAQHEFQAVLMTVCLWLLSAIIVGALVAFVVRKLTPVLEWVRRHRMQAVFVAPFVICLVYVGATKNTTGVVTYPYTDVERRYLYDAGSYVTNDMVHVNFSRSAVVPDTADFLGYARPCGSTNDAEWVCFLETTFAAFSCPSNIPYAGALTNDFQFFTTYTPGPVVHTNGVAVVIWSQASGGPSNHLATIRTGVYTNGFRIAPNPAITNAPSVWPLTVNLGDTDDE